MIFFLSHINDRQSCPTIDISAQKCVSIQTDVFRNIFPCGCSSATQRKHATAGFSHDGRQTCYWDVYDCQLIPSGLVKVHHNNGEGEQEQIHWPVLVQAADLISFQVHCEITQLLLVESFRLLSSASSRRSLALRFLYWQYSSAIGPRSSF